MASADVTDAAAQHLAATLSAATYDATAATGNVFVDWFPAQPDTVFMFRDTGGEEASVRLGYDEPSFQVIVRAHGANTAKALALQTWDVFHGLRGVSLPDGTLVVLCRGVQSSPILLGEDDENRTEYSLNFALEVRNATAPRT